MSETVFVHPAREAHIGPDSAVRRLLPQRHLRRIGAWCFFDHFGPVPPGAGGVSVGPHPHVGLQTATWLFEGDLVHLDSIGSRQRIRPGQLNLMTAGRGIAHSEDLAHAPRGVHGVQFWIALPDRARFVEPTFAHHPDLPLVQYAGIEALIVIGSTLDVTSPAHTYTPLLMAELRLPAGHDGPWPLRPDFEHALAVVEGAASIDGTPAAPGALIEVARGRPEVRLSCGSATKIVLIGGAPFDEALVLAWNWVVRTAQEAERARSMWARGEGYGDLSVFGDRQRISSPPLAPGLVAR